MPSKDLLNDSMGESVQRFESIESSEENRLSDLTKRRETLALSAEELKELLRLKEKKSAQIAALNTEAAAVVINCRTEADWVNLARTHLSDGVEIDLLWFQESDIALCRALAESQGMVFRYFGGADSGHFFRISN